MLRALLRRVGTIPKGMVSTYGAVARAAGYPGAARQVAWALHGSGGGVPWHRVVGAGGRILLLGDAGLEQRLRLAQEGVAFRGGRVLMSRHECRWRTQPAGQAAEGASPPPNDCRAR